MGRQNGINDERSVVNWFGRGTTMDKTWSQKNINGRERCRNLFAEQKYSIKREAETRDRPP